jgi:branched-chain amino acid transport system ATP-binding protein
LAAADASLLSLEGVNVYYGAIHALRDVSLNVRRGEVVTLLGANGAGKSTTLRAITGLLKPESGRIVFDGADIAGGAAHKLVARGVSMAPEGRGVFANLTVLENLEMGAYLTRDKAVIKRDLERAFTLFPRLKERTKQRAGTLSGGEQQMLAIGRALMVNPKLLLLDEPMEGLAPIVVQELVNIIRGLVTDGGMAVVIVEQHAKLALSLARQAIVLDRGRVVHRSDSHSLLQDSATLHRLVAVA